MHPAPTMKKKTKAKTTKTSAVADAERKLWRKERRELVSKKRAILKEAAGECARIKRAAARIHKTTLTRLRQCDQRAAILDQRLGA